MKRLFPIFLIVLIDFMGLGLLLPSMPFAVVNFGAPYWAATIIISLYSLGQAITAPFWGRLSDRVGRRTVLVFTSTGFLVCNGFVALAALSHSLWLLVLARLGAGLMAGNAAAAFAYVADVTVPEKRAKGMGVAGAAIGLGFILGPALGGLLGGGTLETADLFWPSIAALLASCVNLSLSLFWLEESLTEDRKAVARAEAPASRIGQIRRIAARPVLARMLAMVFLFQFAAGLFEMAVPYWTAAALGWGPKDVGKAMAAAGIAIVIAQGGLMGRAAARFGEARLAAFAAFLYGVLLLAAGHTGDAGLFIAFLCAMGMAQAFFSSPITALISRMAGAAEQGAVQGARQSMMALARIAGPGAAGALYGLDAGLPFAAGAFSIALLMAVYMTIRASLRHEDAPPVDEDGEAAAA